ncbi:MAG: InlB B-repeat-containing protein [Paludibacteraceae bacterium]|nr:InlB B-repeat-containing protein [Paludibacteraceae bacterium]
MKNINSLKTVLVVIGLLIASLTSQLWADDYYILGPDGSWTEDATHKMVSSGITNWVYKNLTPSGEWTLFKVKTGSTWYGKDSGKNNVTIGVEYTPTTTEGDNTNIACDFTANYSNMSYYFFFNTSTNKLMIHPLYYLAGTCSPNGSDWDNTQNPTTYDATNGYFKCSTKSLTANIEYSFKFCGHSGNYWFGDWSGVTVTNGTKTSSNSGDIKFKSTHAGVAVVTFVPTDNTMVIHCPYQVSYAAGTGGSGSVTASAVTTYGSSCTLSSSTFTKAGYTQDGWTTSDGGDKVYNLGATYTGGYTDVTLYPHWSENNYTVTVSSGANGSVASTSVTGHIATLADLPTATANPGYYFVNWTTTAGTLTNSTSATTGKINGLTSTATVTANFAPIWRIAGGNESSPDALGDWSTSANQITNITTSAGAMTSGYVEVSLPANTDFEFKVFNASTNKYWGNNTGAVTKIIYTNKGTAVTLANDAGSNQTFKTAAAGTYRFTWNVSSNQITIGYPTSYKVTFGKGTGGASISASGSTTGSISSGDYVAASENITFTQTASSGYTFSNWYTTKDEGGSVVSTMGASDNVLNSIAADATVYSRYTPNNYTVTFDYSTNNGSIGDLNGATNTEGVVTKSVTYASAYGTLPTATKAAKGFVGWYTTASDSPVEGTRVTAETIVSTASNHTLYARFEDTYTVNVQFKCGSDVLYPSTSVTASATSLAPTITAPEILGYSFSGWTEVTTSYATFGNSGEASTWVKTTGATTVVANYTAVPTVYFKNNLGWENVYVTFDAYFNGSGNYDDAPGNNTKPYYQMTQLGTSDIFYCEIPSTYTTSNYASWANGIAFNNVDFNSKATTTHTGDMQAFNGGEFTGRMDFDPKATMFIPYNGDTETRNGGTFYRTGCWMKYNSTSSGYTIYANTYVTGSGGSAVAGTPVELVADVAGGFEFKAKVNFTSADYSYGFMLHKEYQKNTNDLWYTNKGQIYSTTTSLPWFFSTEDASENGQRCEIHTEALGEYEFTVSFGTGRPVVDVVYPVSEGDWRLVYKDLATWSGDAHTVSWYHPSRVIKAKASTEDIVSFFVAYGSSPSVELQKCTAIDGETGAQTWTKQGSNLDISSITAVGIYNFKVEQNSSKVATASYLGGYDGNFYVRTDASDGGWTNYKTSGSNTMTYSEYSKNQGYGFSHYFMRHVNNGTNIKFCIANDYSECITDTFVSDSYVDEWIGVEANIRFMWNHENNAISRAYLSGSSIVSDRFLVLEGDAKMFDEDGNALAIEDLNANEINFTDDQNWIYETTVKAQPGARIKLTADFASQTQYFYGSAGARTNENTVELLGGSGTDKYKIRVVYDFKTNRLIKAFIPEGTINTDLEIDADLMIIREHQENAQQISFNGGSLSSVKTVYGAMKFNKYTVNGKAKESGHASTGATRYERDLFWISFPFDVKLSDVFGFGTYGTHWIIQYYDGKGRAENGFWVDSDPNWKYVLPSQRSSFTLNANEGYVLALDLDEMTESSSVWNNGVEDVYIYFPSKSEVSGITATSKTVTINQTGYECTIDRRTDKSVADVNKDRRVADSYWHCIGVPSFANFDGTLAETSGGTTIAWNTGDVPFLYEWDASDNFLTAITSANFDFKPMYSYLVQYSGTTIYWSSVNTPTVASIAARRAKKQADYNLSLSLLQGETEADHALLRLTEDEEVTNAFEFNQDLCKETNKNQANIWTLTSDSLPVAGNSLSFSEQTTVVPVGVKIVADGDYTFSIPEGTDGVGVVLVDKATNERTNLGLTDYSVSLTTGTYSDRFALEISPSANMPTDVETISDERLEKSGARKVLSDGVLYLVKDGVVYNARGARVK